MNARDELIAAKIFELLDARAATSTICPSDAARALADEASAWRALMPEVRRVAALLVAAGLLRVTAHGEDVPALAAHGPIRLGRVSATAQSRSNRMNALTGPSPPGR